MDVLDHVAQNDQVERGRLDIIDIFRNQSQFVQMRMVCHKDLGVLNLRFVQVYACAVKTAVEERLQVATLATPDLEHAQPFAQREYLLYIGNHVFLCCLCLLMEIEQTVMMTFLHSG